MKKLIFLTVLGLLGCKQKSAEIVIPIEPPSINVDLEHTDHSWLVDHDESTIRFDALEKGKSIEGLFDRFEIAVNLDLENPETGEILAVIDLTSVEVGNADRNKVLMSSEMFYVRQFPTARFQTREISRISAGLYEAKGELSLKGISKNIVLPFTITQDGADAIVNAKYEMNRLEFNIGTGSFMSDKYVGYPVTINIEIRARKANVEKSLQ